MDTWDFLLQPSTCLSVSATISNLFLATIYKEGLVRYFWLRALRGLSVKDLQCEWDAGQSLFGAFRAFAVRRGLFSSIPMFIVSLSALLRSPLNQAAVRVIQDNVTADGIFTLQVAQKLPDDYTAYNWEVKASSIANATDAISSLTWKFASVVRDYNSRVAMTLSHADCGDSCVTTINGFGFHVNCTSENWNAIGDADDVMGWEFSTDVNIWAQNLSSSLSHAQSSISTLDRRSDPSLYSAGLNISIFSNYTLRTCLLQPSIIAYPVTLANQGSVSLNGNWSTDQLIETVDYTGPINSDGHDGQQTTIGGFQYAGSAMFKSSAYDDMGVFVYGGLLANTYFHGQEEGWSDPTDDILNAFRELSFRASLYAAADNELNQTESRSNQTVQYTGHTSRTIYSTQWSFMAAGLTVSVVAVLGVLPLFHGFWELGRDVSMSPLEIAKAFDAPLLANAGSNCEAREIARQAGNKQIVYGVSTTKTEQSESSPLRLRLEVSGAARKPHNNEIYT